MSRNICTLVKHWCDREEAQLILLCADVPKWRAYGEVKSGKSVNMVLKENNFFFKQRISIMYCKASWTNATI